MTATTSFGPWRAKLWPIHNYELKKILPMTFMFALMLFTYTILRDTKDTLVVSECGNYVIPYLKFWGVLPAAIIVLICYSKLSNLLSKPALFYSTVLPFVGFFALFAWVLYPARESLQPDAFCNYLESYIPKMKGLTDSIRHWTFSLFYIMAELWGSVIIMAFWTFANDTTKTSESKRIYTVFPLFGNLALIPSGGLIIWCSTYPQSLGLSDPWQFSLNYLMGMAITAGLLIVGIYYWINKNVLTDARLYSLDEQKQAKKSKPKLSMKESFKLLIKNKYLGYIAILVMAYGITINLVEVTWKGQLKLQFPVKNEYSAFMGLFSMWTGFSTFLITFFLGGPIFRKLSWSKVAQITPVMIIVTGALFFSLMLFKEPLSPFIALFGTTPLWLSVLMGMIQNIGSKGSKYSFFDPTKEQAYIPLPQEEKIKGKAAIDVVGARLGKSGGSLIQMGLDFSSHKLPLIAFSMLSMCVIWISAARALGRRYTALLKSKQTADQKKTNETKTCQA
ncbi:MAG: Npt1/Npt2 family nucleotide transporter [Chlamydiota bacterium]|nr:Npt1/Npt2 family nucleotide transporter [Chlamydiota bacterium]